MSEALVAWRRSAFPDGDPPAWSYNADLVREIVGPAERKTDELARLRAENAALSQRVAKLERLVGANEKKGQDYIKSMLRGSLAVVERVERLEQRAPVPIALPVVDDIKRGPIIHDAGIWAADRTYRAGDLVTCGGASWVATIQARGIRPGDGSAFRLVHKTEAAIVNRAVRAEVARQLKETAR